MSRSMRMKQTEELRQRIQAESDPVGFLIKVASGEPVQVAPGATWTPTAKQVLDANLWLGDRIMPKVREVDVTHDVDADTAARIRAAREKVVIVDDTVNKGGTPVEGVSGDHLSSSTSLPKIPGRNSNGENSDGSDPQKITAKKLGPPGSDATPVEAELLPALKEKSAHERAKEAHRNLTKAAVATISVSDIIGDL